MKKLCMNSDWKVRPLTRDGETKTVTLPAIDIEKSGTRREDLLLGPDLMPRVWLMRRMYMQMISTPPQGAGMDNAVATEAIIQRMAKTKDNMTFLENLTEGN